MGGAVKHILVCTSVRVCACVCMQSWLVYRSEGFALTGYDIPGCVDDGAWMLWENSSAVAVAAVAHPGLEKLLEFHYGIGPSGVHGSIRLVFRSTDAQILLFVLVGKIKYQKRVKNKKIRNGQKQA